MIHIFLHLLLAAPLAAQRTPNAVDIRSTSASVEALALVRAFPALTFSSAVHLAHAGDGSNRLFVVERQGLIRVFANQPAPSPHGDASTTLPSYLATRYGLSVALFG